jgi:hypothetical protein
VGDANIVIDRAMGSEAVALVELACMKLSRERDLPMASQASGFDERFQDLSAQPVPAVIRKDCHPANVSVREQPPGGDRLTRRCSDQRVQALSVCSIPFKGFRNALLEYKDRLAHCASLSLKIRPGPQSQLNPGVQLDDPR